MTKSAAPASGTAAELRQSFDRSFAVPSTTEIVELEDLLAIGVGNEPFAVRLVDVAGVFADKRITSLPSPVPELVGLAGFRGSVVPVYDLSALLGYPRREATRWLLLVTTPAGPIALAFDRFDGHVRVSPDAIASGAAGERSGHVREVARAEGGARPIVHVKSVVEAIARRAQQQQHQQQEIPQRER